MKLLLQSEIVGSCFEVVVIIFGIYHHYNIIAVARSLGSATNNLSLLPAKRLERKVQKLSPHIWFISASKSLIREALLLTQESLIPVLNQVRIYDALKNPKRIWTANISHQEMVVDSDISKKNGITILHGINQGYSQARYYSCRGICWISILWKL